MRNGKMRQFTATKLSTPNSGGFQLICWERGVKDCSKTVKTMESFWGGIRKGGDER